MLPFWDVLTESEQDIVRRSAVIRHYKTGNILHGNCDGGASCLGMTLILSGELRVFIISEEGREITLFRLREKDSCVFAASCVMAHLSFDTEMTAETDSDVLVVPVSVFGRLAAQNVHVRCYMYETASARLSTSMWVMQQILFARFDQRLAAFLLDEYERTGSSDIKMTQEQIASRVNSAREVVARMLKQFALDGLIENRRGKITLKNIEGLYSIK